MTDNSHVRFSSPVLTTHLRISFYWLYCSSYCKHLLRSLSCLNTDTVFIVYLTPQAFHFNFFPFNSHPGSALSILIFVAQVPESIVITCFDSWNPITCCSLPCSLSTWRMNKLNAVGCEYNNEFIKNFTALQVSNFCFSLFFYLKYLLVLLSGRR